MGSSIRFPLSRGMFALIDDIDFQKVAFKSWYADPKRHTHYARTETVERGVKTRLYMHRVILGVKKGQVVDHINGNGLDNRRSNLRVCSHSRNGHNRTRHVNPHGHIGISWDKRRSKWVAQITVNYKNRSLGRFDRKADAINARNRAYEEAMKELS